MTLPFNVMTIVIMLKQQMNVIQKLDDESNVLGIPQELVTSQEPQDSDESITPTDFAPVVTATCRAGTMLITVATAHAFYGKPLFHFD